jgi:hypothetical protein
MTVMALPKVEPNPQIRATAGEGDVRGPFGFGRPAHGSDPLSEYGFVHDDVVEIIDLDSLEPISSVLPTKTELSKR